MNHSTVIPFPDEFLLAAYRDRTLAMLRRYNRAAVETGRLPSLLGREFFRARVTSYTMHTLEDAVIFVFDVERCLAELTATERTIIARVVLQEYTRAETARLMGCTTRTIERLFPDAVDHLTEIMLERGLLAPSLIAARRHKMSQPAASQRDQIPRASPAHDQPVRSSSPAFSIQACQAPRNGVFAASA